MTYFAELISISNFSFLRGGSHPDEIILTAHAHALDAVGIADWNSVAGLVRAHVTAKEIGMRFLPGVRLVTQEDVHIVCYPKDRAAYGRLCRLLTKGNLRAPKGACYLFLEDILSEGEGQVFIVVPGREITQAIREALGKLSKAFPTTSYLGVSMTYSGRQVERLSVLDGLSRQYSVPLVASNDVLYHDPSRRPLQDVLTCIREHSRISDGGFLLEANAERHMKSGEEMARLFVLLPQAVARTKEIVKACTFSLDELSYEYPDEVQGSSATPQEELVRLTWVGAVDRYPGGVPDKIRRAIAHELELIEQLDYASYFLTVYDLVRFARSRDILCQGRGSAANSSVCYCLGITSVDPNQIDLLFERFVSAERNEPPDIDVDFEHERREEVIQYIYEKYGRHRAGIAATVITYRSKSAVREVGKVMGLSEDVTGALSRTIWGWSSGGVADAKIRETGLDPDDPTLMMAMDLTRQLIGFPRHLSQHVGGFVMTRGALNEVVPVLNAAMADRTFVEWDKDDLAALGILKVDVLALGMLTCIAKAFELFRSHYGKDYNLATVPTEDPRVYDMLCEADSVGVFQVESRAQMSMLPRLKPRIFYDLVIEVAIVRPGPIQGDMVHPYLRRRDGTEPVSYPSKELEEVLGKTLGVPLFQEQAMKIAIVAGGFTPSEADLLRRAMATFRKVGTIHTFGIKLIEGMTANGYEREFAENCFRQIEGFGEYGFPESHAASFALLVYVSSWIKCHYPDVFCCAILNSQPMGFYAPAQLVRDARDHGVEMRPVDINHSDWDCTLEPHEVRAKSLTSEGGSQCAVRLGFRQIKGMREDNAAQVMACRSEGGYDSVRDLWLRTGLRAHVLERLASADCFRSIGLDRRAALWAVKAIKDDPLPLFAQADRLINEPEVQLPSMPLGEHVVHDYQHLRLSLKAHPMSFLRSYCQTRRVVTNDKLPEIAENTRIWLAGLVLVRQRPGSAKGIIFATLEDETGVANIIVWPKVFEKYRSVVLGSRLLAVRGRLQREGIVIHIVADHVEDWSPELARLSSSYGEMDGHLAHADEIKRPGEGRAAKILPRSRDFH